MNKTLRTIIYIIIILCAVILIATIAANIILENKLENLITNELPENITPSYKELSLHTLDGTVTVTNPRMTIQNEEDSVEHTFVKAEKLIVSGFSYWDYFIKKEINVEKIIFENPSFEYYIDRKFKTNDSIQTNKKIGKPIFVETLQVSNSQLTTYEKGNDYTKLYIKNLSFEINDVQINDKIINNKIPFEYRNLQLTGDSIFSKANTYENLMVGGFSVENQNATFNKITFKTKYSKAELSKSIDVERDHYDLSVKAVTFEQFDFGYSGGQFYAGSKKILLDHPRATIFRDKLIADDLSIKPLYSKSLRELPFQLTIDSVMVERGFLEYKEKVNEDNTGGAINFKNLDAKISNLSNTYKGSDKTEITIEALFMDKTPMSIHWNFDVQNEADQFIFQSEVGSLEAEKMNEFAEPNLKVRLEGRMNRTYFTVDGNNNTSRTDMKINYSDFKINVLQKDGKSKNKFLSAVVNIFISKDSDKKDNQYREATAEATRNKTKSIFNFLWISIKNALEKCVTGNTK